MEAPKKITEEDASHRFNIHSYDLIETKDGSDILLFEGNTIWEGDLTNISITERIYKGDRSSKQELIIINGSLTINGDFAIGDEVCPTFLILGDLHCDVLHSVDEFVQITGNAHIKYAFNGNYNHGAIKIDGVTDAPFILISDHHSDINPSDNAIKINYFGNNDDHMDFDYYSEDLPHVLLPEIFELSEEDLAEEDLEDLDFYYGLFISVLKAGKTPFKTGGKTVRKQRLDRIEKMGEQGLVDNGTTTLDFSDGQLDFFPLAICEIKNLETLILEKNILNSVPDEIEKLTNLKHLNLRATNIEKLPDNIGRLKNLEILNLNYCSELKHIPESFGELENLKKLSLSQFSGSLPDSVSNLKLDELVILHAHIIVEGKIIGLPEWVFKFRNLKRLCYKIDDMNEKDFDRLLLLNPELEIFY